MLFLTLCCERNALDNLIAFLKLYKCLFVFFTDVVSVVIRSSTTKNCWSPQASSNPCEPGDGTQLSLKSFCQGEGVMMSLRRDGSIAHSCSGKCVYRNEGSFLALRDGPCDTFTKREGNSGTFWLIHQTSGSCVNLDAANNLVLSSCNAKYLFEITQSGMVPHSYFCLVTQRSSPALRDETKTDA